MVALKLAFWGAVGALAWTHAGYPVAVTVAARLRPRPVRKSDSTPPVSLVVAAHDEQSVIEQRLDNLLELDYPAERLEIVVASDASEDRTDELVEAAAARDPRVRLLRCPRAGKVAAQHRAAREAGPQAEILAFSDANSRWEPDALRRLVANLADPDVAYVCGRLRLEDAGGRNREGLYWRYELWLRRQESLLDSVTGGNGAIYAVRRSDYVEDDPRYGHDLGLPYVLVQRGRRAVYEPAAVAWEKMAIEPEEEYGRKLRMHAQSWSHILSGRMLRPTRPLYLVELFSHRILRYLSGPLHVLLFTASVPLAAAQGGVYAIALAAQLGLLALAAAAKLRVSLPGANLALYYVLVTWATLAGLVQYLTRGVPVVWEKAEGTR